MLNHFLILIRYYRHSSLIVFPSLLEKPLQRHIRLLVKRFYYAEVNSYAPFRRQISAVVDVICGLSNEIIYWCLAVFSTLSPLCEL